MSTFFDHPLWLFALLAPLPALVVLLPKWRNLKVVIQSFSPRSDSPRSDSLFSVRFEKAFLIRTVLFSLSWICLVFAVASPKWGHRMVSVREEGYSVIFVMDISRSMTAQDMPGDRLTFASHYASLLLERMTYARCGVVLARGSAVLSIPLTSDHHAVSVLFESLSPSLMSSPGSSPAKGVLKALDSFPANSSASRTIILMTDGDDSGGSLSDAADKARRAGVQLLIVGFGTAEGAPINIYPLAKEPEFQTMVLHDEVLRLASQMAGSQSLYVSALDTGSARRILEKIDSGDSKETRLVTSERPDHQYGFFLSFALGLFSLGLVVGGRVCKND